MDEQRVARRGVRGSQSAGLEPTARESSAVKALDAIRPKPAKVALPVLGSPCALRELIAESIRDVSTQKAAAGEMAIDPAQLARQLQNGHLTIERIEALGPTFAARLGERLVEQFGSLSDPRDHARRKCDDAIKALLELRQFIDAA